MPDLLFLSDDDVARLFTLDHAHTAAREAFVALGRGEAILPDRLLVPGDDGDVAFCYAARSDASAPAVSKFGAVHGGNEARGLPAVHAMVTVLDAVTGAPAAVMGATTLTTRRTAAGSAVAVEALSPHDDGDVAVIGSGVQALAHLRAIAHVRPLSRIRVFSRTASRAHELASAWRDETPETGPEVEVMASAEEAVRGADVVITATTATTPVLEDAWVKDGALVVSVGSFSADRSELPTELMARARVIVDHAPTAFADAGCVVQAIEADGLHERAVETLGEVLVADHAPTGSDRPTVYVSVGVGVQDATAAAAVLTAARDSGADIGTVVRL